MKMRVSSCYVCGRKYEPGEEYLQVEVETSKEHDEKTCRTTLVHFDSNEDRVLFRPFDFRLSNWMRTSWVCVKCAEALPVMWRQIFTRPTLNEYVPVEQLGAHTFVVKRRDS